MRRLSIIAFAIALAAGVRSADGVPGRNGLIAFSTLRPNGSPGVASIRADGGGRRNLTGQQDVFPVPSPDGRLIAFQRLDERGTSIYLMRADGSHVRKLAKGASPSWSPDGRRIAFAVPTITNPMLAISDVDGGHLTQLTEGAFPVWSPDGRRIAFYRLSTSELWVIRPNGSGETKVAGSVGQDVQSVGTPPASWSPDSRRLTFVANRNGGFADLHVARADGTGLRRIVHDVHGTTEPTWSPDRKLIAYVSLRGAIVKAVSVATGKTRRLAGPDSIGPAWSPDGKRLAFVRRATQL